MAKIPAAWILTEPMMMELRNDYPDLTRAFTHSWLLDAETKAIVTRDSAALVEDIKSGELTAVQVTKAFCFTVSLAHQLVRSVPQSSSMNE